MDNNNYQNQFGNMPVLPQGNAPKKSNTRKIVTVIVAMVAVIAVVAVLLGGFFGDKNDVKDDDKSGYSDNNYEKAIDNLFEVVYKGKFDKIEDCMPKEAWEYIVKDLGDDGYNVGSKDEFIAGCEEGFAEFYKDKMIGKYGEFKKFDYEIEEADEVSDSKLEVIAEYLNDNYEIDKEDVKKAYKLNLDGEIIFEDDELDLNDTAFDEVYSVKIKGKWYLVDRSCDYLTGYEFVGFYDFEKLHNY